MMESDKNAPQSRDNNKTCCSVYGCDSKSRLNKDLHYHLFPKPNDGFVSVENKFGNLEKVERLRAWTQALKTGKKPSLYMKVCSLHFKEDDYILPNIPSSRRHLKKTAVPSCNLPTSTIPTTEKNVELGNARLRRQKVRSMKKNELKQQEEICLDDLVQNEPDDLAELVPSNLNPGNCSGPAVKDIGVQVQSGDLMPKFVEFIKTDSKLSTLTGIESFAILNGIVDVARLVKEDYFNVKMNLHDKIIMTYVKLKQNVSYAFLAIMFDCCTPEHCQRIFYETVQLLSKCVGVAISWPSREEISKNIPNCIADFKDVVVVLDCTEIFIQKPKNLCCQLITYSHYKGSNTCKIMTGVTPAGNISFVSKPYGGRASDKVIFEQSSLVNLLNPGDAVMVDRGFLIDEICELNRWKCIRRPFLRNKKQFSKSEAVLTSQIAKARVHIERSNQRIKTFKIVGEKMPVSLVPLVEDIFTVIYGTVNLNSPILKDDKFIST